MATNLDSPMVSGGDDGLAADWNALRKDLIKNAGDYEVAGGTGDAIALAIDAQYVAYAAGDVIKFEVSAANTGAVTVNVNGIGGVSITKPNGDALIIGDLVGGQQVVLMYDGAAFQMVSASPLGGANLIEIGTFGETIDGTTTPVLVYLKVADGKFYKADADATESTYKTKGFAINSGGDTDTAVVVAGGLLGGFAGLTPNADQFVGGTAGETTETPGTNRHKIGVAWSATQILIDMGVKMMAGVSTLSTTAAGNNDDTIVLGFRPKLIELEYYIQGHGSPVETASYLASAGFATFLETTLIANNVVGSFSGGAAGAACTTFSISNPSATDAISRGSATGANAIKITVSINSISDVGFVLRRLTELSGVGSTATVKLNWRAWGY